MSKLFVLTGMDQPMVNVSSLEIEQVGEGEYRIGCVEDAADNALAVVGQTGPLGPDDIEPHIDRREDYEDITPWPERTIFTCKTRALKHALSVVNSKIRALSHFHDFWYCIGAKVPQEYVDDMDQLVEGEVESYRTSLHASKMMLELQIEK
tara:strand:+ start:38 stop:490 length:453 start_codon:yes stop_codon:yes gene_type:complete